MFQFNIENIWKVIINNYFGGNIWKWPNERSRVNCATWKSNFLCKLIKKKLSIPCISIFLYFCSFISLFKDMCLCPVASFSFSFPSWFDPPCLLSVVGSLVGLDGLILASNSCLKRVKPLEDSLTPVLVTLSCLSLRRCFAGLARGEARHRSWTFLSREVFFRETTV